MSFRLGVYDRCLCLVARCANMNSNRSVEMEWGTWGGVGPSVVISSWKGAFNILSLLNLVSSRGIYG